MLHLDAAATSPVREEALAAAWPFLTASFGNPSSTHGLGEEAAAALADARKSVAAVLGCRATEVVFTSGGTEANNLAVKGLALGDPRGRHVVTSRLEHESVLASVDALVRLHGFEVSFVDVDARGTVSAESLGAALRDDTTLVSLSTANNEVGTVQDIAALTDVAHARGVPFHTDAIQAAGSLDISMSSTGVDALSVSGHKLGAPKGVGVLAVRSRLPLEPLMHGGGQERGRRSGTENVAFAVAFAVALRLADEERRAGQLDAVSARDAFVAAVLGSVPGARLTGHASARLPRHASLVIPGINGETVLLELEQHGVLASAGAACAAGHDEPSHVLLALGIAEDDARTALRFTWGASTTAEELGGVADALLEAVARVSRG
ncbi:cysteine desulfurase [Pseudoclavibacter sp. RFBJ3]|uniref:cysteine desulfurase family protein n=1 Tax=unclassified Pseudoclavibacter TaxID=2615177 RepID=UPI000CE84CBB|nr:MULTISPECIES: cysteine desulfurase family protein [unclassified Pseudoclavibacter]PPF86665.1 cysteine desulfurase [Pseudoclavibacter sp. RFBJ5]PPF95494.1 cysteine desulfurase [Pseudoclavibacter sp. RFBJ3]PPF97778.1 cysteine desulfurase [Pseudoclavibacter sp. RFBH5]PPG22818.1 cysteine desulfurase [Pseudoclavibacter sp. RFBI4]